MSPVREKKLKDAGVHDFQGQIFNISYLIPCTEESLFTYLFILGEGGGGEGLLQKTCRQEAPHGVGRGGDFTYRRPGSYSTFLKHFPDNLQKQSPNLHF